MMGEINISVRMQKIRNGPESNGRMSATRTPYLGVDPVNFDQVNCLKEICQRIVV